MLQQLNKAERKRLRNKYESENQPLFMVCEAMFTPRSAHLNGVCIESEEVFCATAALLDALFQAEHVTQQFVDNLWNQFFKEIRQLKTDASEHDKLQVTHTAFSIVRKLLSHHWDSRYRDTLFDLLTKTIAKECRDADKEEIRLFLENLFEFSDILDDWINNVYDGHLSREINTVLREPTTKEKPHSGRKAKDMSTIVETFNYSPLLEDRGARLQAFFLALKGKYLDTNTEQKDFIDLFQNSTTKAKVVWIKDIIELKYLIVRIEKYVTIPKGFTKWQITCAHFQIRVKRNENIDNKTDNHYVIEDLHPKQFSKGKKIPANHEYIDKVIRIIDPKTNYNTVLQDYLDTQQEHEETIDKKDALANGLNTDIRA